ncbi:MAG: hypothetical protein JW704_06680 [Anaerolineaceae bacterium]|nr:hypothetical protein [Anaerolineaceae bacterium]
MEVELDNGEVVRCSDNHPFMLRDGTWLRADQLVQGCSLMPMYSEISSVESGDRIDGYEKVFDPASLNHKVVAVRRTGEEEWLYDLTVDEYHNFAIGQGVFVHNSMEDIEYLRDKMFTAIKIPRSYYGGDAEAEAGLAQKDVRFARTCMRIQREFRNGIRQVLRVHMAALGIDPDSIPWDTRMTTPSSIFELQQIEVMNAQAGLISSLSEHFPEPWLLERVLHLSQDEAVRTKAEKDSEREKSINDNARIEATIQAKYPGVDVGANGEMGVAEEGVDVSKKLNKLMESIKETRQTSDRVLKRIGEMEPKLEKSIKRADALARTALRKVQ